MRTITADDIVKNRFKIKDNEIIESNDGEFYSKQIATQVLAYQNKKSEEAIKKLKAIDQTQRNFHVQKICANRFIELKSDNSNLIKFDDKPIKQYEIYKLNLDKETIMLSHTRHLDNLECDRQELYYSKEIALQIYEIQTQLNENVINSYPELMELYEQEIIQKQNKIEELKIKDEKQFQDVVNNYNLIKDSEFFKKLKNNYELVQKENIELKSQIKKHNEIINNLTKKLQISLGKYEELKGEKVSFLGRIANVFERKFSYFANNT